MRKKFLVMAMLLFVVVLSCGDDNPVDTDTQAPTLAIDNPVSGADVKDTIDIEVSASDNVGVVRVEFYVDTQLIHTDSAEPWAYSWDTHAYEPDSYHRLLARAYDAAGNTGESDTIHVTIANIILPQPDSLAGTYHGLYRVTSDFGTIDEHTDSNFVIWSFTETNYVMEIDTALHTGVCFCCSDGSYMVSPANIRLQQHNTGPDENANCIECNESQDPTGEFQISHSADSVIFRQGHAISGYVKEIRLFRDE